jgi:hypothetical protein
LYGNFEQINAQDCAVILLDNACLEMSDTISDIPRLNEEGCF